MPIVNHFCGDSIEIVDARVASRIELNITKDNQACTRQWFSFAVETKVPERHSINIKNAGKTTFLDGWLDYEVFVSYDKVAWFTVPTSYNGESLLIEHDSKSTITYYSYFVPYSLKRQDALEKHISSLPHIKVESLGMTPNKNSINLLSFGDIQLNKKNIWIIARQHPGETMAQWIGEGIVSELRNYEQYESLFERANVFIVMNMNPDGSEIGNHRTNLQGANLNRCWASPSLDKCPEVYVVRESMDSKGVDFFLDLHGDESIPYNFMMSFSNDVDSEIFKHLLMETEPTFQLQYDYSNYSSPCQTVCCSSACNAGQTATSYVAEKHGVTSLLLEASFKQLKNSHQGKVWNNESCIEFGSSVAKAIRELFSRKGVSQKMSEQITSCNKASLCCG